MAASRLHGVAWIEYKMRLMGKPQPHPQTGLTRAEATHALVASFLGWTLDAFDFFVLVFVLPAVAKEFHKSIADLAFTITATLGLRPLGALGFGWLADRYGRRMPLMINVIFYSLIEVASGLAPSYGWFLFLRALYGIGMGGEWGVGASMAMEAAPPRWRGLLSGLLQEGYAVGYLLAAAAYFLVFPHLGWRPLFFLGGAPALLTLYIRAKVPESKAWERARPESAAIRNALRRNLPRFVYLVALMTMMSLISHGTQDLYPTFLEKGRGLGPRTVATIAIIYNLGAILGGLTVGWFSDHYGRRRAMIMAALAGVASVPLWVFPHALIWLTAGAFLMQFMVQGVFGVIPAHLSEMSPAEARGTFSGMAYQLGVLFASGAAYGEALIAQHLGYEAALAIVATTVLIGDATMIAIGKERKGSELHSTD
ncbi:MAG TPA: MFS transporter [Candidatus Binataceae bacterium]|nr:MFS transporter [Candidatus Binataceae bacterium]